ncbi:GNAT family N-acetyltransferase [Desertivirga xinjiangensis]|uniref:GNAT family N-acetyltransferase n=1 Tax=Desertivirga xinjiangensis TaxID=539206 RepID=UPI00210AB068|nr:GNAT family N-acetyltransferase [Pedobacter xinjiangensis]
MIIQTLEQSDIPLITELQPADWPDIIPVIDFYTKSSFCFPIKAIINKAIVGIGAAIIHNNVAWLAHIIVHPDTRNQGIGRLITQTLISGSQGRNCKTIYLIATEQGGRVYDKLGFECETEYLLFKDVKVDGSFTPSENIVAYTDSLKTQISNLDKQVSGEDRMFQHKEHLPNSFVYLQNNIVQGCYMPTFREGLITANTTSAGIELMKLRLTTKRNAAFPINNLAAKEFMYEHYFKEFNTAKRMRLGIKRPWQPANIYNRIGGNLG